MHLQFISCRMHNHIQVLRFKWRSSWAHLQAMTSLAEVDASDISPLADELVRAKALLTDFECRLVEDTCNFYAEQGQVALYRCGSCELVPNEGVPCLTDLSHSRDG